MPKKFLILVETSIFCESSKSKKIAIIRNTTEPKIRSKGSGSNKIRDVNPVHQSNGPVEHDIARDMICVVCRSWLGSELQNAKKPGDHQVVNNVIKAHQSLRFLGHLSWFDRRVLAAKMKIRLSIFAHKLQFAAYGLHSFRRIQGTCNYLLFPIQNITTIYLKR